MEGRKRETMVLFTKNVPHVLEKIFFYLDYASYKKCHDVSTAWRQLITSDSYQKKAKIVFREGTQEEEVKLCRAARDGNASEVNADGKSECGICKKVFSKASQLRLHVNIHYMERPFRCEDCAVSFRTKGHLLKHERSAGHFNKVNINQTFGAPSAANQKGH